jgi:hypothetical protein
MRDSVYTYNEKDHVLINGRMYRITETIYDISNLDNPPKYNLERSSFFE